MAKDETLERNNAVARQFFVEWANGNADGAAALFAPGATFWVPSTREKISVDQMKAGLAWVTSRLKDFRFEIGPVTAEDNRVNILADGFATTVEGAPYNNNYCILFEFEDGKIKSAREYNDTALVWGLPGRAQMRMTN